MPRVDFAIHVHETFRGRRTNDDPIITIGGVKKLPMRKKSILRIINEQPQASSLKTSQRYSVRLIRIVGDRSEQISQRGYLHFRVKGSDDSTRSASTRRLEIVQAIITK
jgi:hypothetical protein